MSRLKGYFTAPPCPPTIIQISTSYVSGIRVEAKEGKVRRQAVLELPAGVMEPHFDRTNIAAPGTLTATLKECLGQLQGSGKKVACLVPEACLKILVVSLDSLPASESEREKIIRWRAKKQMAVLPEDTRLSYELVAHAASVKVLAALARSAVIREYEGLFSGLGLQAGVVTAPTISLLNLVDWESEKDLLLANMEDDSLGLMVVSQGEPALYRLKTFPGAREDGSGLSRKIEAAVQEIENTAHFIEDREKRQVRSLWVRSGLSGDQEDVLSGLRAGLSLEVRPVQAPSASGLTADMSAFLAPLAGLVPWRKNQSAV
jgi:Tfp pilus assembly PilM family ATPase